MATNKIVQVVVVGSLHGQETNNVLHFTPGQDNDPVSGLLQDVIACLRTALLPGLSDEYALREVRAKQVQPTVGDEQILAALPADKGGIVGQSLPSTDAAVISVRTGLGGRSRRGRHYIPGIPEAAHSLSRVIDPTLAALIAFCACMAEKFIGNGTSNWHLIVYSRKLQATGPATSANGLTLASDLVVQPVIGTMRSRRLGRGA